MTLTYPLLLASQSPRRKELLSYLNIPFEIIVSDSDETPPADLPYDRWAEEIAKRKSEAVKSRAENPSIIIAADTMVFHNGISYGKPQDKKEAEEMLENLSGTSHEVITGVSILSPVCDHSFSVTTIVHIDELSPAEIDFYIKNFQPFDKAGGYGIQDWMGMVKLRRIEGSYTNVMGLPVAELRDVLIGL